VIEVHDADGRLRFRSEQHNLRTSAGADFWNAQLFSPSPSVRGAGYIGLSTSTIPNVTDTSMPGEITTGTSLVRTAQLTPTHSAGTNQSQFSYTWTYDGTTPAPPVVVGMAGLFNNTHAGGGTLALETSLIPTVTLTSNGQTLQLTWTISY
jgi:hypothetical protein